MTQNKESEQISNQSERNKSERGFFSELGHRRVPQVLGLYMAGSWTFLEFFDSIIGRHNLAPHWADISLLTILLMLPTVIILAYRHGAPGAQSWSYVEKLGIPSNLIAIVVVLLINYSDKDLGSRAEMIETVSPDGSIMTVIRPKEEYRKRVYIGFFKLKTNQLTAPMQYGISYALSLDLDQDPYINSYNALLFERPMVDAGFTDMDTPRALMLKIARDSRLEFYMDGDVTDTPDGRIQLRINLYSVADGRKLSSVTSSAATTIFNAIDEVTPKIKQSLGIPPVISNETADFPIEEQLTSSMAAYQVFINSWVERTLKNNFSLTEQLLQKAIELDPSFALASADYAFLLFNQTRIAEGLEIIKKAEQHSYRLHITRKFQLATIGNIFKGQHEESKASLDQWLSLYPDSLEAWSAKANYHVRTNQRKEAIKAYQKLLELEPYGINRYISIGELYVSLGDLDAAVESFNIYLDKNPANVRVHISLGDSYRRLGNFEQSDQEYRKAKLLETNSLIPERRLIQNIKRQGEFDKAEQRYLDLIADANSAMTKYELSRELSNLYIETGRDLSALEVFQNSYELLASIAPENAVLITKMFDSWAYARSGEYQGGEALLKEAKDALERFDNDIYRANLLIAESLFQVFKDSNNDSIPMLDEAQEKVRKFIGSGNDHTIQMMRGIAYHLSERHEQAIPLLREYTASFPYENLSLWITLADSLLATNQTSDARDIYEQVLKEYPMFPDAQFGLAKVHYSTGDYELAKSALDKALTAWNKAYERHPNKQEALTLSEQITAQL